MVRIVLLIFLLFISLSSKGQNRQLLYNFDDLPQALLLNPGAETNFDMHVGLPLLSGFHVSAGSSGVSLYDIFQNGPESVNDRIRLQIAEMTNEDFFLINQQMEILYLGWRDKKRRYYSAGIYQEIDAFAYFPKDLAVLTYEGNSDHIGRNFKFSDAAFTADALNVFHLGFTNYYSEDFNYGFRAKLYSGVFNASSVQNTGTFTTVETSDPGANNYYQHYLSQVDIVVNTSGWANLVNSEEITGFSTMSDLGKKAFLGGNLGLGFDAGFTWYPEDKYRVTASILDLGFINQTKDVENYRYYGSYETSGIKLLFPGIGSSPAYWDEWEDDLDRHLKDETYHNSYITWRPVKVNASLDLGFSENSEPCNCRKPMGRRRFYNHLGVHFFAMKRPKTVNYATTVYFDKTFSPNFRGKISYTVDSFSYTNIGLLASARLYNFNVYLAADNLLDYANLARARNASVQLGFQLIFNRE